VLVATRAIEAKGALGPSDWRVERRSTSELPAAALATWPESADLEAAQPIRAGDVLTPAMVRSRVLVRRGDVVTLLLEGPGFRIMTQGVAVTDGRRGDSLRVLNPTSKRETLGKIEGAGLVRVPFATARSQP
jgi:flagella basal body P-ring formation protein FlgA